MQEEVKFLCIHAYEFLMLESALKYSRACLSFKIQDLIYVVFTLKLMSLGSLNLVLYQEKDQIIKSTGLTYLLLVWKNQLV